MRADGLLSGPPGDPFAYTTIWLYIVNMDLSLEDRTDALFHALADRTRRDILRRSLAGEHTVTALASAYDMSFAAVQKHVAVLERAGLLAKRRLGREAFARGKVEAVRSATAMLCELEGIWRGRVARIDAFLAQEDRRNRPKPTRRKSPEE